MSYDQFVITHLDFNADYGFARQISSSDGSPSLWPIGFTISYVAQALYAQDGSVRGISIPQSVIRSYVPKIGDELLGVIAYDEANSIAYDEHGYQFLRNWFYAAQRDIFGDLVSEFDFGPDDDHSGHDDYADDIDADSLAEIQHGRAHEMYNS